MDIPGNKKIYFASDQHFGAPTKSMSKERESHFIQWLDNIEKDAAVLFLLGDLFDFWFEYKTRMIKIEGSSIRTKPYFFNNNFTCLRF